MVPRSPHELLIALRTDTYTDAHMPLSMHVRIHTNVVDKSNFIKPGMCQPMAGMRLV